MSDNVKSDEEKNIKIRYYTLKGTEPIIDFCPGDLIITVNALADYTELLSDYIDAYAERMDDYTLASYRYHIERCKKIRKSFESQMGYDRDLALEKCQIRKAKQKTSDDVGEEALVIWNRMKNKNSNVQKQSNNSKPHKKYSEKDLAWNRIYKYIEKCGYDWTHEKLCHDYQVYYLAGAYCSSSFLDIIEKYPDECKMLFEN